MAKKKAKELVKVEPMRPLTPFEEIEKRFEDLLRRPFSLPIPSWWPAMRMPETEVTVPKVDIFEEGDDIVVKAELPGMKKEEIEVNLTGDKITISGEKKKEEKVEKRTITILSVCMVHLLVFLTFHAKYRQKRLRHNLKKEFLL